jgi:YidC/Oxa1 family membrane protein insertase
MRTEFRFILAIALMIGVLVVTNMIFPPIQPEPLEPSLPTDSSMVVDTGAGDVGGAIPADTQETPVPQLRAVEDAPAEPAPSVAVPAAGGGDTIVVEGPLYRFSFTTLGARIVSAELPQFPSSTRPGPVQLIPEGTLGVLGHRILVASDTLDLRSLIFEPSSDFGLTLREGGPPETLTFVYRHETQPFEFRVEYEFTPDSYVVVVRGSMEGLERGLLLTDLGPGLAMNEIRPQDEERALAYVGNHVQDGINSRPLRRVEGVEVEDGPFVWAAFKSKYFLLALMAGADGDSDKHLGGIIARERVEEFQADVAVTQGVGADGIFGYRLFIGPQDYARLAAVGNDLEDVNPYGWRFIRPVMRPFVGIIMTILDFLHDKLNLGYGWVLIVFGILMRIVLFPLNQKAMRSQIKNMAVQPLMKEIQTKYKDNPERLQKEMMKLYKEHGFNPLGGCLPMLLPFPVLIALFFVFQNTIQLRGVPFLWLPDLSVPDPFYILPAFLGISMFLLQWVSLRSMAEPNPQMKMMMWMMPIMMVFIFMNLASGLNLYYATANIATIPQQYMIAQERKRAQAKPALKLEEDG